MNYVEITSENLDIIILSETVIQSSLSIPVSVVDLWLKCIASEPVSVLSMDWNFEEIN